MRVLVATDLSEPADEALRQAATLAGIDGALAALHVLPSLQSLSALFPQRQTPETLKVGQIIARAADAVRERVAGFAGRDAEIFVEQGTPYAEIVRRAEAWKADIVVVGSHGQSGLERVFGGVAERVVRYAHCRVLVARKTSAHGWVLAATDYPNLRSRHWQLHSKKPVAVGWNSKSSMRSTFSRWKPFI